MNEFKPNELKDLSKDEPLFDPLQSWANDAEGYKPFDAAALPTPKKERAWAGWRAAATLAAAAVFVFALAQTSFTVSVGGTTLRWGGASQQDVESLAAALAEAQAHTADIEQSLVAHAEAINAIAIDNALLGDSLQATAMQLARRQDLESVARVYDMQNLAQLVHHQP